MLGEVSGMPDSGYTVSSWLVPMFALLRGQSLTRFMLSLARLAALGLLAAADIGVTQELRGPCRAGDTGSPEGRGRGQLASLPHAPAGELAHRGQGIHRVPATGRLRVGGETENRSTCLQSAGPGLQAGRRLGGSGRLRFANFSPRVHCWLAAQRKPGGHRQAPPDTRFQLELTA